MSGLPKVRYFLSLSGGFDLLTATQIVEAQLRHELKRFHPSDLIPLPWDNEHVHKVQGSILVWDIQKTFQPPIRNKSALSPCKIVNWSLMGSQSLAHLPFFAHSRPITLNLFWKCEHSLALPHVLISFPPIGCVFLSLPLCNWFNPRNISVYS